MPRRPVCLVCLLYIAFILISFWAGLPLLSGERSANKFKAEVDLPTNVKVWGKVEEFTKYETYSKIILTDSIISTDLQFKKTQLNIFSEADSQEYNSTNSKTYKVNKVKITLTSDEKYSEGSIITAQASLKFLRKPQIPASLTWHFSTDFKISGLP